MSASKARAIDKITAREIMRTNVLTVSRNTPLSEVERLLGEHRIGGAPVTDESGHIVGVVSMRDLLERYTEDRDSRPRRLGFYHRASSELDEEEYEELDSFEVPEEAEETVADIMSSDVHSVPATAFVPDIAEKMIEHGIHRVLVEDSKRYIGLITSFDLLGALKRK